MLTMCHGLHLYYLNFRIKLLKINWLWSQTIAVVFLLDNMTLKLPVHRSCSENVCYLLTFTFSILFCICQRLCCSLCVCATDRKIVCIYSLTHKYFFHHTDSCRCTHRCLSAHIDAHTLSACTNNVPQDGLQMRMRKMRVLSDQPSRSQSISGIWEAEI